MIRHATHSRVAVKTVKYTDLRPLASHRPVNMHTSPTGLTPTKVGDFVFYSHVDSSDVVAGLVTDIDSEGILSIQDHRQAPKLERRFVPLYFNSRNNKYEQREKALEYHTPAMSYVHPSRIMLTGVIAKFMIPPSMLDALRSLGVADE